MTPSGSSDSRMDKCPVCKGRGYWETWTYRGRGKVLVDCWDCDASLYPTTGRGTVATPTTAPRRTA